MKAIQTLILLCALPLSAVIQAGSPLQPEPSTIEKKVESPRPDLIAHEWGTFTQVVGSDGLSLPWWTPYLEGPSALPEFVKPVIRIMGKTGTQGWRMRMETPVIYFYANKPADLIVTVDEARVPLTEVYPGLSNPLALFPSPTDAPSFLNPGVSIASSVPNASRLRRWDIQIHPPENEIGNAMPAVGEKGGHYRHAREVPDAWWVVKPAALEALGPEVEKFIFYRGAGDESMPQRIAWVGNRSVFLRATDSPVFLIEAGPETLKWNRVIPKAPDEETITVEVPIPSADAGAQSDEDALVTAMEDELEKAGLTHKEAEAMVATWHESWLGESGLRVLELLPRQWIDETLPLTISPTPGQVERVFVARWELITPNLESEVLQILEGEKPVEAKMIALKKLDLGRFGTAVFDRAAQIRDMRFRSTYRGPVGELNRPATEEVDAEAVSSTL